MKIRSGLISNSSSSSFIFAYKEGVDIAKMLDILGVRVESPLSDFAESLIWHLFRAEKYPNIGKFLHDFDWREEDLPAITQAFANGWRVHGGFAEQDGGEPAAALCNMALNVETDEVILKKKAGY